MEKGKVWERDITGGQGVLNSLKTVVEPMGKSRKETV